MPVKCVESLHKSQVDDDDLNLIEMHVLCKSLVEWECIADWGPCPLYGILRCL